jgi:hypothetical protein
MNIHPSRTHVIIRLEAHDEHSAPECVIHATDSAERAASKIPAFEFWGYGECVVVALDDPAADPRWKGKHATPREFFNAEYDDGGIPRAWIVRNALR